MKLKWILLVGTIAVAAAMGLLYVKGKSRKPVVAPALPEKMYTFLAAFKEAGKMYEDSKVDLWITDKAKAAKITAKLDLDPPEKQTPFYRSYRVVLLTLDYATYSNVKKQDIPFLVKYHRGIDLRSLQQKYKYSCQERLKAEDDTAYARGLERYLQLVNPKFDVKKLKENPTKYIAESSRALKL